MEAKIKMGLFLAIVMVILAIVNRDSSKEVLVKTVKGKKVCSQGWECKGELKKMVAGPTGVHHEDQKIIFKDKERDSRTFLDVAGVKDGSKIVLIEDVIHKGRRYLEMRRNATMEIAEISLEVDKFAKQIANLETKICGGKRVVEKVMLNLIEQLMTQLIKLD